jgi:hypothetical protein
MDPHVSIYRKWLPKWLRLPLLIIALFPHLMLMSLFHSNISFSASFMGIEQEDIQYLLSLMYGSIVVTLLIFNRFTAYFRIRTYIIIMCASSMLILGLMSITNDYGLMMVLRTLGGIFGLMEGACFLPLIIGQLKTRHARMITYLILYGFILTGGTLTASLVKPAIADFGWSEMMNVAMYFHIVILLIAVLIFTNERLIAKYPLFQFDYTACLFLLITLHSGAFVLIFGRKLYWFESGQIVLASVLCLIFGGLFILKQYKVKRPIFHFEVLLQKNMFIGLLMFFFFYVIRSGVNNVYTVMASVWGWPWEYIVDVQYFNVIGTILGIVVSGFLIAMEVRSTFIFGFGFFMLAVDCAWFITVFYPDTTLWKVGLPLALQGFAQGWLFTPLAMFLITGIPAKLVGNGSTLGTSMRFWATNFGFAIIQNLTYLLNKKHYSVLQQSLNSSNPLAQTTWNNTMQQFTPQFNDEVASTLTTGKLSAMVNNQALLLSNMEIFNGLMWLSIITCLGILLQKPTRIAIRKFGIKKPFFAG